MTDYYEPISDEEKVFIYFFFCSEEILKTLNLRQTSWNTVISVLRKKLRLQRIFPQKDSLPAPPAVLAIILCDELW